MSLNIPSADPGLGVAALVLALTGACLLVFALLRLRRWQWFAASLNTCMACVFIGAGVALFLLAMNLYSYQRLSYEQAVAEISFEKLADQRFRVELKAAGARTADYYELNGDEWQVDARILVWKAPATLLGLDHRYRLERISGRYRNIDQERNSTRSVYALARDEGLEIWALLGRFEEYLPWLNAYYGSATYLPMAHEAHYQIKLGQSGLLAKPLNEKAEQALKKWY